MPFGESFTIIQGIFLKSLSLIYLITFISLLSQIKGLFGKRGIEPLAGKIEELLLSKKKKYWLKHPSIFWLIHSDRAILTVCWLGIFASVGAILGIATAACLLITWIIFLSFVNVGSPFLNFQWDALLLESGLISIFYAILSPAPPIFIWLYWLLIFRFIFASGFTKWVWGSKEWKNFTAMNYHYETQPLPTKLAYYLHHQPHWFAKLSVWGTYCVELLIPLFIFTPYPFRIYIFSILVGFQLTLILTGNFAYFNWLTIVLCLPLLSDTYLSFLKPYISYSPLLPFNSITWITLYLIGAVLLFIQGFALIVNLYPLKKLIKKLNKLRPIQIGNSYGLFVHMTTERNEITIEGSYDGVEWKEYIFHYKPGPLNRPPTCVAPHQPRLDWQMWFAALGHYRQNPWFSHLIFCLFDQSPHVLKLLKSNPFPEVPPRFIRCEIYRYTFTSLDEKRKTGNWWNRDKIGKYTPTYSLTSFD